MKANTAYRKDGTQMTWQQRQDKQRELREKQWMTVRQLKMFNLACDVALYKRQHGLAI